MEPQVIAKRLLQLRGEKTREEVAYKSVLVFLHLLCTKLETVFQEMKLNFV